MEFPCPARPYPASHFLPWLFSWSTVYPILSQDDVNSEQNSCGPCLQRIEFSLSDDKSDINSTASKTIVLCI